MIEQINNEPIYKKERVGRDWILIVLILLIVFLVGSAVFYTVKQKSTYSFVGSIKVDSPLANAEIEENTEDEQSYRQNVLEVIQPILQKSLNISDCYGAYKRGECDAAELLTEIQKARKVANDAAEYIQEATPPVYMEQSREILLADVTDYIGYLKQAETALQGNDAEGLRSAIEGLIRKSDMMIGDTS